MTDLSLVLNFRNSLRACTRCGLSAQCTGPVPWSGDADTEFAIMAEAPGATEDKEGKPLIGDSGAILRHWLRQAGFNPSTMAMMNAVSCRPVRVPPTPTKEEMEACRPWVHGQLEVLRPKVLITLGVTAFTQIREGAKWPKLLNLHGRPMRHPLYGFVVWSSYHPSAYLRGRSKKYEKLITEDLAGLRDWWNRYQAGEAWPNDCAICGGPFYNFDDWAIPMCDLHSQRQGILFPEDVGVTT